MRYYPTIILQIRSNIVIFVMCEIRKIKSDYSRTYTHNFRRRGLILSDL
jgi:hypothetical protein